MQLNMPLINRQPQEINPSKAKGSSSSDDKAVDFKDLLHSCKSSQYSKSNAGAEKTSTDKVEQTKSEGEEPAAEKEDTSIEQLILLLLKLYKDSGELNKSTNLNSSESTNSSPAIKLETGSSFTLKDIDGKNKSDVMKLVNALLKDDKLPSELTNILKQYVKNNTEASAIFPVNQGSLISENLINQSVLDSNKTEMQTLKNLIIEQIQSLLPNSGKSEAQSGNTILDKLNTLLQEEAVTDVKTDNDKLSKAAVEPKVQYKFEVRQSERTSTEQESQKIELASIKTLETKGEVSSKKSSSTDKEDAFLKGILQGGDKKEDKINLLMNTLKVDKNPDTKIQTKGEIVVQKANFVNDIVKAVKFMDTANLKELKVSINPKEIGELLITVTVESGKLKAHIEANSKDSYNLLMSNLDDIKKAVGTNEVKLQDVNVSIYNGDTTFFKDGSQRQNNQQGNPDLGTRNSGFIDDEEIDVAKDSASKIESQINMLA